MNSEINNIENIELSDQTLTEDEKNINLVIQFIVEGFLKRTEQPPMKELLDEGVEDIPGVIYNDHIAILQTMLAEELLTLNLNLKEEVEKTGEKFELGQLSALEEKYLDNRIANTVGLINVIKEKVNK